VLPIRQINKRSYLHQVGDDKRIQLVQLDLTDSIDAKVLEGCDIIINTAAFVSPFEKDQAQMEKVNVGVVKKLYELAKLQNIKKFIQVSSTAVLGTTKPTDLINEDSREEFRPTYYAKTKKAADDWLDIQEQIPTLIIYPGFMLGEYDSRPSSGAILFALKMKKFNYYCAGEKNFVAAKDVAGGIYQAIQQGISGNYILGGENRKISEALNLFCQVLNIDNHLKEISRDEIKDKEVEKEFCFTNGLDFTKAKKDFSYAANTNLEEQLNEVMDYFTRIKILRVKK
jgi:nucleoside-diphosphate-sugar epimerase